MALLGHGASAPGLPLSAEQPTLTGQPCRNFASQFAALVRRVAGHAGDDLRPFRFHDLRRLRAINWLK